MQMCVCMLYIYFYRLYTHTHRVSSQRSICLRSQKTLVLKRLFAIKKGWLDARTGELRRPSSTDLEDDEDGGDEDDDVTGWKVQCSKLQRLY